ncbi:hypothetical protein C0J45_9067 [Silurus meridionalis]|uniref:Uncharacterized protein n=1 Tax=Silurus meridionalis TaxID=175797 RepID=A0A8T0BEK0_SILME|nr:hypothetical protein HF521_022723 [Silurus meridionalis]KAI5101864.1 hypothetical protein C0J45_9067 [Silurus meridionalis]
MGNNSCSPSPEMIDGIYMVGQAGGIIPDITLDKVVSNYLSLNSSFALNHQYSSIQGRLSKEQLAVLDNNLTSIFSKKTKVSYGGVGVVALAMSFLLDTLVAGVLGQTETELMDPYRRIFGPDNSSEVSRITRDYLRRVPWMVNNSDLMAEITDVYDQKLKLALIKLYESMAVEKRISTAALKLWINGAAVHLHMRIHGIRLFSVPRGSAESLRLSYRTGLGRLVQMYASYLRQNVKERAPTQEPPIKAGFLITEPNRKVRHRVAHISCQSQGIISAILSRILAAQNIRATETFFEVAGRNIDKLIRQEEHFELPSRNTSSST